MEQNQQQLNVKVDPSQTVAITSPEGNHIFAEGVILRKVSKFLAGTAEDAIMPIPCFYDVKTGKPRGSGLGDMYSHQYTIFKGVRFPKMGKYQISLEQYMRTDTLKGVISVGASIIETPENDGKN